MDIPSSHSYNLAGWNDLDFVFGRSCRDLRQTASEARLPLPWMCFLYLLLPTSPLPMLAGSLLSLQGEDSSLRRRSPTTLDPLGVYLLFSPFTFFFMVVHSPACWLTLSHLFSFSKFEYEPNLFWGHLIAFPACRYLWIPAYRCIRGLPMDEKAYRSACFTLFS